jgi:3-oxoacyl-[acyl-carrier protein] reductase
MRLGLLAEFDDAAWQRAIEQNLMSVVRLSRHALPHLRAAGGGSIVNITALSVLQPIVKFGLSVATWAGVIGYAKTLSLEVAAEKITVNTICPGRISTSRLEKVFGAGAGAPALDDQSLAEMGKSIPLGRLGTPDEIAGLVAFLASPWGAYVTGATFHVDGGRGASLT